QIVGQCLLDVAEHDYFAVRYGGDEFIVICNVGCKEDLDRLTEHIRVRVEQQNKKNALPYQLSLSMGSAFFEPSTDNIDSFLQRMDQRMYENKRIFYSNSKNDRRRKR
ncbi:MAG TPA: diguanylate cyclase, partial [Candidatus Faecivivens stercoripullorum]|nr:diguanylate cyclase [Candidatus Faecivivens stercoripullorum]